MDLAHVRIQGARAKSFVRKMRKGEGEKQARKSWDHDKKAKARRSGKRRYAAQPCICPSVYVGRDKCSIPTEGKEGENDSVGNSSVHEGNHASLKSESHTMKGKRC